MLLQVKNLTISTGKKTLLHQVSFDIDRGETLAVVGESGSGKSISSLAIMGLLPQALAITEGEILFNGVSIYRNSVADWQKLRGGQISMIFQEPMTSLNPLMQCGIQVTEVLMVHEKLGFADARKKVLAIFNEVKLPRPDVIFTSYPHEISGGQKQRVMIAMALACNPQLIIADEPTTALDASVQFEIVQLLSDLQKNRGCSILFITHDLNLARSISHHTLVMQQGRVVEYRTTRELFEFPHESYTRALLQCRPTIHSKPEWLQSIDEMLTNQQFQPLVSSRPATEECILSVENLSVWYEQKRFLSGTKSSFQALKNISFSIRKGETLALVGESGSGKTTLGKTILRMEENRAEGSVKFRETEILGMSRGAFSSMLAPRMQMVFQDPFASLNPQQTVGDAIMEPMVVHGIFKSRPECREKTLELLKKVGLSEGHFSRYPHEFSGGQRQRIVIARALALNPEFIILDESVSALDVSVQAQILNLLKQLQLEFGITYLFITHDMKVVRFIATNVLVLKHGEMMELSTADELFTAPAAAYTKQLLKYSG